MATITADTFLDDGTARTAGETWTCNGARLTIRTDSRWHANAPASMTGSLGSLTISSTLGGGYTIDGRNVRWLPYDGGSGNVPAIGTTITGGTSGASGYLLGVWASLTSAPTAVGAAMPATGFIKLREASAAFVDNDALSGIGATANGVDVVGWIEVVHDQATAITVPRLGDFTVRGDWFQLGTTSGAANQLLQVPTNGSSTTYVPGVWIETAVSSGVYEFWPAIYAANMITTNFGTDDRSKVVCMETNGNIRIGHNGTTAVGKVPVSGLRVRVPNVFGRQCTTAARATNAIPNATAATRPDFTTTSAGAIDIENFLTDWYLLFAQPYAVKLHHVGTFDYINISECATALDILDGGNGQSRSIDARTVTLTSNFAGGTMQDWNCPRSSAGTTDHAFEVLYCSGQTFTNVQAGIVTYARSTGLPFAIVQSSNLTFNSCRSFNGPIQLTTCFDCTINDHDHVDRYVGTTNSTTSVSAVVITASCNNILVDGVTFGLNGAIANNHPYGPVFSCTLSSNIRFRNLGSSSSYLATPTNSPSYLFSSGGNNRSVKVQRCYLTVVRTGLLNTVNSDTDMLYEHLHRTTPGNEPVASLNSIARSISKNDAMAPGAAIYGSHFAHSFSTSTLGAINFSMNEPTAASAPYVAITSGTPRFTSNGSIVMQTIGDQITMEMPYFAKGFTAFDNLDAARSGTNLANHTLEYQIDTGSGWNGTWKAASAANLVAETISPSVGVKLKLRVTCNTSSTTNVLNWVNFYPVTTSAAQLNNLYPLDTLTLELTGLKNPSEVRVYEAGTTNEVAGQENITSGTFSAQVDAGTYPTVDISVLSLGYLNLRVLGVSFGGDDVSIPIQQQLDRQYANP